MNAQVVRFDQQRGSGAELLPAIEAFLVDADLAASTVVVYERTLEGLVDELGGDANLGSINRADLERFLKNRYGHTQATTFNRNVATVGSFFTWCEDQELIVVSPARKIKRRKVRLSIE